MARSLAGALGTTLHDHAITDALDDATEAIDPASWSGSWAATRCSVPTPRTPPRPDSPRRSPPAGRLVLTGGGPGAMEAANLGAYLSPWPDALPGGAAHARAAPAYDPGIDAWVAAAYQVRIAGRPPTPGGA